MTHGGFFTVFHLFTFYSATFSAILLIDELIKNGYDKRIRPYNRIGPVNISMNIELVQLGPIKEEDMTMEMTYYYRQWWNDPRLTLNGTIRSDTISEHPANFIWIPDAKVVNAISLHEYPGYTRTIIKSNGDIYFSQRIKTKVTCNMELYNYPMDSQRCFLQLESYAFNSKNMRIHWTSEESILVPSKEELSLTGYDLTEWSQEKIVITYGDVQRWDNLFAYFVVKRTIAYFITKAYIPTILLVVFNIGSYMIPDTAEPARVTLIITTFLASMLILQSVTEQTVKVPYTTAMQWFMLINIFFLVVAIIEYIAILYLRARKVKRLKQFPRCSSMDNINHTNGGYSNDIADHGDGNLNNDKLQMRRRNVDKNTNKEKDFSNGSTEKNGKHHTAAVKQINSRQGNGVHILDEIFRFLMPGLYILFCSIYFPYYYLAKEPFQR